MISSIHRGGGVPLVATIALLAAIVTAAEPSGHFRLQVEPVEARSQGGSLVLRLKIHPFVPLEATTLTVAAPAGFELRSLTPSTHSEFAPATTSDGNPALRARLDSVDPALETVLDLEWIAAPGKYGTIEFIVRGIDGKGRTVQDAVGYPVPDPASHGRRRLGAVEFPAVVLPTEKTR